MKKLMTAIIVAANLAVLQASVFTQSTQAQTAQDLGTIEEIGLFKTPSGHLELPSVGGENEEGPVVGDNSIEIDVEADAVEADESSFGFDALFSPNENPQDARSEACTPSNFIFFFVCSDL